MLSPLPKSSMLLLAVLLAACGSNSQTKTDAGTPTTDGAVLSDSTASCSNDLETDPLNCGACGHDCLGASCVDGLCQPTVLETVELDGVDEMWLNGLALGPDNVFVYNTYYSLLGRISKQGGAIELLVPSTLPTDIAVYGGYVYWSVDKDVGIPVARRPIAGGEEEDGRGGTYGTALAVDDDGVFVSDDTQIAGATEEGAITRHTHDLSHDLSEQSVLFSHWAKLMVTTATHLVWTDVDDSEHLFVGGKEHVPEMTNMTQVPVPGQGEFLGLAADATDAYVTDGSTLWRVPLSEPMEPTAIFSGTALSSVSVDDSGIYLTTADSVLRLDPAAPEAPQVIAQGQDSPFGVAVDQLSVYWINARNKVMKVAK